MIEERTRRENTWRVSFVGVVGLFLAMSPVLDPYVLVETTQGLSLRVNDFLAMIIVAGVAFIYPIRNKRANILIILCALLLVSTGLSAIVTPNPHLSIQMRGLIVHTFYAIILFFIWQTPCREVFFRWVERVVLVVAIIAVLQFVLGHLNIPMWNGKLPFFSLSKDNGWSGYIDKNTGDIRPCGIFQESSYIGIYLLVYYSWCLLNSKIKKAIFACFVLVLSSSLVAIFGMGFVTFYYVFLINNKIQRKLKRRLVCMFIITVFLLVGLYFVNEDIKGLVDYVILRVSRISTDLKDSRMGSVRYRLVGNIDLYSRFTMGQKIFGHGSQYAVDFGVVNYGNSFVNFVLYYGVFGLFLYLLWIGKLYLVVGKRERLYFWVAVFVLAIDQQWFSWYFFYLLSACVILPRLQGERLLDGQQADFGDSSGV